jgi:hypothetical protein
MAEPLEMPNIDAIVESSRVARRSEEGARMHVSLSVPVKEAPQLLSFLAASLKNPVRVGFSEIQARLPESATITGPAQDIRYAPHITDVDGVPAEVMLPVTEGGRRNKIAPHPYKDDPENKGKCLWCNHGEAYQAHEPARIEDAAQKELAKVKSNGHRANPDEKAAEGELRLQAMQEAYQTPHAFAPRTQDDSCDACGHQAADEVHQPAVEVESIPEHLQNGNGLADKLIEQAQATEAVPS